MSVESLFQTLAEFSVNPLFLWFAVFFIAFVIEEGAAAVAVLLTLSDNLSLPLATTAVYCGVVTTDVGLYGLGYSASRFKWASRWIDGAKVQQASDWMGPRLLPAVIVSRLLPWMLPPTFIACGFLRLPFRKFFWFASSTGAVWTAVVFGALLGFGNILLQQQISWPWGCAMAGLLALVVWRVRAAHAQTSGSIAPRGAIWPGSVPGKRLPPPASRVARPDICWFGRLPTWMFYGPVALMWLSLAIRYRSLTLFTAANPSFECGGFVGESKNQTMMQVALQTMKWFAPHVLVARSTGCHSCDSDIQAATKALADAKLDFPVVAKPDRGHHGYGVRPIYNDDDLRRYIEAFPSGANFILQKLVEFDQEAGVFYVRAPGERTGQIFSMNLSEPAQVVGNGKATLRELITSSPGVVRCRSVHLAEQRDCLDSIPPANKVIALAFARSLRLGATLKDCRHLVTPALLARFDDIADGIRDFHFGRFDVRFNRLDEFQRGENFQIVEVNGVGAEANHIWDCNTRLRDAYKTLFAQYRLAFHIGQMNRARGFKPTGLKALWTFFINQHHLLKTFQAQDAKSFVSK